MNTRLSLISISFFCSIQFFIGCESSASKKLAVAEDGIYETRIWASAGDDFELKSPTDTLLFTPYPYNLGKIKVDETTELSCAVISKQLKRQSRIKIRPIGLLLYQEDGLSKKLIVSIPVDKKQAVLDVENFIDLATKYPAIKNIIQEWTLSKCGIGCARFESWEDGNAAGLYIQRSIPR